MKVQDWADGKITEYTTEEERKEELIILLEAFVSKCEEYQVPALAMFVEEVTLIDSAQYARTSLPTDFGKIPPEMVAASLTFDMGLLECDNQDIYGRLCRTQFARIERTAKEKGVKVINPNNQPKGSTH